MLLGKAIDLTPGAFQKLGNLDTGVLDISWKAVHCPKSKYYPSKPSA
jgi:expansin (peptidoglycan-binding protein)